LYIDNIYQNILTIYLYKLNIMDKKLNILQNMININKLSNTKTNMSNSDLEAELAEIEKESKKKGKIIIMEDKNDKVETKKIKITKTKKVKNEETKKVKDEETPKVKEVKKTEIKKINTKKNLKPIIKWSGGKYDEIKNFQSHIPTDYEIYLEPFIGGGSVFFSENPEKAVITDVHKELIDFYTCIKEGKSNDIYNFMENHKNDEITYYEVRDKIKNETVLDNAKIFYYLRKTCFRGMLRYNKSGKFNIPFGKYKKINYEELKNKNYEELLKKTTILKKSFEYIFENYNNEKNFMFLDPPYDSEFTDYGYCQFGKKEHEKLAELFKKTKIRCLMIIGKTKMISELYKDYIVGEYQKKYRFKLYAGRVGDEINTTHLIIKNYK
jgi:DNA adenine methylase